MAAPRKYPDEFRERAMRLANDLIEGSDVSMNAACRQVGAQLGIPGDTVRNWFRQSRVDAGKLPGTTTPDRDRIVALSGKSASCGGRTRS